MRTRTGDPNDQHVPGLELLGAKIGGNHGEEMCQQAIGKAVDVVSLVVQMSRGTPLTTARTRP